MVWYNHGFRDYTSFHRYTGVAQLVEHWSPKPGVGSSSLSSRANLYGNMGFKTYLKESYTELVHKVTWPTWSELQNSAVLVMVTTAILAVIVALMDLAFSHILEAFYDMLFK